MGKGSTKSDRRGKLLDESQKTGETQVYLFTLDDWDLDGNLNEYRKTCKS